MLSPECMEELGHVGDTELHAQVPSKSSHPTFHRYVTHFPTLATETGDLGPQHTSLIGSSKYKKR